MHMPENGQINMGKTYILDIYARERSNKQGETFILNARERPNKKQLLLFFYMPENGQINRGKTFNFIK